ncbi:hypothetical protein OQA88_5611 [Cercophora sp. LCS_1]
MSAQASPKYINKLASRRILILGGTSGVGFAVAQAALEYGAIVTISSSNPAKLERALSRLDSANANGAVCDLADTDKIEENLVALFNFATSNGQYKLDHVVFTAGDALKVTPVSEATPEAVTKASVVRFVAPVMVAKVMRVFVKESHEASLTLTGGTNSVKPMRDWSIIAGVGTAVEGLVRGFAVDLRPVRVNGIVLGAVHTELFDSIGQGEQLEAMLDKFRRETLTGTVGRPEDVAEAYLYVMRDSFVTGSLISTDGGRLLA